LLVTMVFSGFLQPFRRDSWTRRTGEQGAAPAMTAALCVIGEADGFGAAVMG